LVVSRLWTERPWVRNSAGARGLSLLEMSIPNMGPTQPPTQRPFCGGSTHLHLLPRLKTTEPIPPPPMYASVACTGQWYLCRTPKSSSVYNVLHHSIGVRGADGGHNSSARSEEEIPFHSELHNEMCTVLLNVYCTYCCHRVSTQLQSNNSR
jgi:hypothetical protein